MAVGIDIDTEKHRKTNLTKALPQSLVTRLVFVRWLLFIDKFLYFAKKKRKKLGEDGGESLLPGIMHEQ